ILARSISKVDFGPYALYSTLLGVGGVLIIPGLNAVINKATLLRQLKFIGTGIKKSLRQAVFFSVLILIGVLTYNSLAELHHNTLICICAAALTLPIMAVERAEIILMGLNKFRKLAVFKFCNAVAKFLLVGGVAYLTQSLWKIFAALLIYLSFTAVFGFILYRRDLRTMKSSDDYPIEKLEKEAGQISLLNICQQVMSAVSRVILYQITPASLATYHTGSNVLTRLKDYIKLICTVPLQFWLKKGKQHFHSQVNRFSIIFMLPAILMSCLMALTAPYYIPLLFGDKYVDAVLIIQILSFSIIPKVGGYVLESREIVLEDTRFYQKISFIQLLLGVLFMIPLVYFYQAVGLAINNLIWSFFELIVYAIRFRRHGKKLV
ncbi:MAG: oligosaccharide flippase family protein, partial [Bdellovibrionota bacterium]